MPGVGQSTAGLQSDWTSETPGYVQDLAFSPRGELLAVASVEGPVTVFDGVIGEAVHELPGHGFGTSAISWRPDGGVIASAGQDGKVRLWDPSTSEELCAFDGGAQWVEKVAFSPDGRYLVTAAGRRVRMWKPDSARGTGDDGAGLGCRLLWESGDHESTITDVRWRPGSSKELVTAAYGGLAFYKPGSREQQRCFEWKGSTLAIEWSPNGKYIATGDQDSTVHFWIHDRGEDLQMFGYPTKVRELAWDPTSRFLATGGGPAITVWDCSGKGPAGTTPVSLEAHEDYVTDLAFQKKGSLLASGGEDGTVALWQPGTRDPLALAAPGSGVARLKWSPDDNKLAAGTEDGRIAVFTVS